MTSVFRLFYRSTAALPELDPSDLLILREAVTKNAQSGVVGYLWRADMQFFQVLEGARDAVEALFARIASDPRHSDVEVLYAQDGLTARLFEGWSMGYDSIGAEMLGIGLDASGARPAIDGAKAVRIIDDMAQAARDAAQFGSPFPFSRKPGESEQAYLERLNAEG